MTLLECKRGLIPLACLVGLATTGCGDDADTMAEDTFYVGAQSAALGASGNEADCATCHSDDGSQTGLSGETLQDIAYLTSYKGGDAPTLLDAANACVTGWMGGTALEDGDPEWQSLRRYLESISTMDSTEPRTLAPEVLEDEAAYEAAYTGGDAAAGEAKYEQYCGTCHETGLTVGSVASFPRSVLEGRTVGRIAQKVRTSGPPPSGTADGSDSTPGPMPFFEPADLSEEDLRDIIAFIKG